MILTLRCLRRMLTNAFKLKGERGYKRGFEMREKISQLYYFLNK